MKVLIIFGTDGGGLVVFKLADDDDADEGEPSLAPDLWGAIQLTFGI